MEDHDKLIEVSTDVKNLCKKFDKKIEDDKIMFDKLGDKVDEIRTNCACRAQECSKNFIKSRTFWTIATSLFILVCGAYGYAYLVDYSFHIIGVK